MPRLERDGEVFILHLDPDDENRFHPDWLGAVESALNEVEGGQGPRALVTVGSGKFWSNGLDVAWMMANGDQAAGYLDRVQLLLARTLASPVVTVAALNGHTFAAGAMWALAHDIRIMREDRGFVCLPEVDIDLPFAPGLSALIASRLGPGTAHDMMTLGRRYGGPQALEAGIVNALSTEDALLKTAIEEARSLAAKAKPVRTQIKETLYADTLALLRRSSTS